MNANVENYENFPSCFHFSEVEDNAMYKMQTDSI